MATSTWILPVSSTPLPLSSSKFNSKLRSVPITSNLESHIEIKKRRRKHYSFCTALAFKTRYLPTPTKHISQFPISTTELSPSNQTSVHATLNSPKGFGPSSKKAKKLKNPKKGNDDDEEEEEEEQGEGEGVIPEIVTNRMIKRMGFSVGMPLFVGLIFFPFFYYLKVGLKIDVPTWVPFIVSFVFFGTALLGVSYGIVSASWDPMREGSLLGWNEAKKNWPVFWQSLRGGSPKK